MKRGKGSSKGEDRPRRVFVGYRRDDVQDAAHWVVRELERRYGKGNVFLDVDRISPGRPYATVIGEWVQKADVFIAFIGPDWLGAETEGVRRIRQPEDFVRREVEIAMQAGKPVIPVLFEDAPVPEAEDLPESLAGLPDLQALRVTREHFDADIGRLERAIDEIADPLAKPPHSSSEADGSRRLPARAAWIGMLLVALAAVVIVVSTKSSPKTSAKTESAAPPTMGTGTTSSPTATTTSTTSGGAQRDADRVVGSYWSDIRHQQFAAAWGLLDSNARAKTKQSERQFIEGHNDEGVTSAIFSGRSSYEGESARVDVSSLTTGDAAHGCRKWHGYYVLKVEAGRWLIDEADIEPETC